VYLVGYLEFKGENDGLMRLYEFGHGVIKNKQPAKGRDNLR
jgi:hypothetical protein